MKTFFFSFLFLVCYSNVFSQKNNSENDSTAYYKNLVANPTNNGDLLKAFLYFNLQKEQHLTNTDTLAAIQDLRMLAIIQYDLGLYFESEISTTEAINYLLHAKEDSLTNAMKKGCYNQLGRIYRQLKDYQQALQYYHLALERAKNTVDSITLINNMGNIYKYQKNWPTAEAFFLKAYKHSKKQDSPIHIARTLDNLSYVQYQLQRPEALNNIDKALKMRIATGDTKGIYSSYRHLALIALDQHNHKQTVEYAEKMLETARLINSPAYLKDALGFHLSISNDPKVKEYLILSDSLENIRQLQENKYAHIKYDLSRQKQIATQAQLQHQKERNRKQLFQFFGILILIGSGVVFYRIISRQRKAILQNIMQTENRISIKVHDDVANNLFHVMSKIQHNESSSEILDDLENIYNKTRDISRENSMIELDSDFQRQLDDLLLNYQSASTNIITRKNTPIPWKSVSDYKKIAVYKVLQELMINMKKHSRATVVMVSFLYEKKKIIIKYADNGAGSQVITKNGLQNAEIRIRNAGGVFTFESETEKGFKAEIVL